MKNIYLLLLVAIISSHALAMESPHDASPKKAKKVTFGAVETKEIENVKKNQLLLEKEYVHSDMTSCLYKLADALRHTNSILAKKIETIAARCLFKISFEDYYKYREDEIKPAILGINPEDYAQNEPVSNCLETLRGYLSKN